MTETMIVEKPRRARPGIRAQRQADRRDLALRVAAQVFRQKGMNSATMADIAAEMGVTKVVLYRRYPSKDALIEALFEWVVGAIVSTDVGPWLGYGSRVRATLKAVRSVEDGYVALVRDGDLYSPSKNYGMRLRAHTKGVIQRTLHFPEPEESADPLAARMCLETITTYSHQALSWWVQNGSPDRDDDYLTWFAHMMRSWREGALKIFGLGDPGFVAPPGPVALPPD